MSKDRLTVCPKAYGKNGVSGKAGDIVCERGVCPAFPLAHAVEKSLSGGGGNVVNKKTIGRHYRKSPPSGCQHT